MKVVEMSKVPQHVLAGKRNGKWGPVLDAVAAGKAVVLSAAEVSKYTSETSLRSNISSTAKRAGLRVTVRKDMATGDLYVLPAEKNRKSLAEILDEEEEMERRLGRWKPAER